MVSCSNTRISWWEVLAQKSGGQETERKGRRWGQEPTLPGYTPLTTSSQATSLAAQSALNSSVMDPAMHAAPVMPCLHTHRPLSEFRSKPGQCLFLLSKEQTPPPAHQCRCPASRCEDSCACGSLACAEASLVSSGNGDVANSLWFRAFSRPAENY